MTADYTIGTGAEPYTTPTFIHYDDVDDVTSLTDNVIHLYCYEHESDATRSDCQELASELRSGFKFARAVVFPDELESYMPLSDETLCLVEWYMVLVDNPDIETLIDVVERNTDTPWGTPPWPPEYK